METGVNDSAARMARMLQEAQATAASQQAAIAGRAASAGQMADTLGAVWARSMTRMATGHGTAAARNMGASLGAAAAALAAGPRLAAAFGDYAQDRTQRSLLMLDLMRERGDQFLAHEAAGCPPVLSYASTLVMDGRELPRPCNYMLLHIHPSEGVPTIAAKRPYVIVDPRAGHGPGIGGFKHDSQVGVALRRGHPVYFVAFRPEPEPGQTIADVVAAVAAFVRAVMQRHPVSSRPIVIGNCQGGWLTALLAATNPDITGPVVFNGAPMAYWSGRVGENPMRYNGGLMGGGLPAMLLADLGAGRFDGAWLVTNFEFLNPARNFFGQYADLFAEIDDPAARRRFLEFQKWWGGYFSMNAAEIEWIVSQLFVGNRLAAGDAELSPGLRVDLRAIRAPIIVFASQGDNITPPQQALNWIADLYASEEEIKLCGQRIVYMVHPKVGHLGIFVSSSIARREHNELASTMKTIEALAPGLYEMTIEDTIGSGADARFLVAFHRRRIADIAAWDDGRSEETALAAVARMSEMASEVYDVCLRPALRAAVTPALAEAGRQMQPLRVQRAAFASNNPAMVAVEGLARLARERRRPADRDNPFALMERAWSGWLTQSLDLMRDLRDTAAESAFHMVWNSPAAVAFGAPRARHRAAADPQALRHRPEVLRAMTHVARGGFVEAVIRMLILLAEARGSVRRDRLERSARLLSHDSPFAELGAEVRGQIIQEQSTIAQIDPDAAIAALPRLLPQPEARARALAAIAHVLGPPEEMEPHTRTMLTRFRDVLAVRPAPSARTLDAAE